MCRAPLIPALTTSETQAQVDICVMTVPQAYCLYAHRSVLHQNTVHDMIKKMEKAVVRFIF